MRGISLLFGLALTPAPAMALDFGNGFSLIGGVELEYSKRSGADGASFGFVDLTLGWRNQPRGTLGFGLDLTVRGEADIDAGTDTLSYWGGLVLTTGFGDVTVGRPRPLLDTLSPAPFLGGSPSLLDGLEGPIGSFMTLIGPSVDSYGISFTGTNGPLSYGAAVHRIESNTPLELFELTGRYAWDDSEVYGGIEYADLGGGDTLEKLILGIQYQPERWSIGAEVAHYGIGPIAYRSYLMHAGYQVSDRLEMGLQVRDLQDMLNVTLYGVSADYDLGNGGYARMGYVTADQAGFNDVLSVSVGFRF